MIKDELNGVISIESHYDTFILDCDGTLWINDSPIPGAIECANQLIKNHKLVLFFTNTSTKTRKAYSLKLKMLGINVPEETVYGSSYVTAHYVKDYHPEIKEIYAFGMNGIIEEFKNVGINVSPLHSGKADAVIAGMDLSLTYEKICYTYKLLHDGVPLICTNLDAYDNLESCILPGALATTSTIVSAAQTVIGPISKPNKYAFELMKREWNIRESRTLMVGDRIDTDIIFGKNSQIDTLLVLTGTTTEEEKSIAPPTYFMKSLCYEQ